VVWISPKIDDRSVAVVDAIACSEGVNGTGEEALSIPNIAVLLKSQEQGAACHAAIYVKF